MDRLTRYISDVKSGKIASGRLLKLAVDRHERDLMRDDIYFDYKTAEKAIKIAELLRHWKGTKSGTKIQLEGWQVFYIASIFGWKRKDNDLRRFTRTYMQVARKNGKTTLLAMISLIHLVLDAEEGSQIWCGATKEAQAQILVNDAGQIINNTKELRNLFKSFTYKGQINRISYPRTQSFIAALGRDSKTQDGFDPSMGNIDEFHEHQTTQLLNVIVSGQGARMQPLLNIITTAGFNKDYPCYSVTRKTGIEILEGVKDDDSNFILIFEPDTDDNWEDSHTWVKSNPNLGVSVRTDFLKNELKTAKNEGGSTEVNFKTKHLNIWTDAPKVWIQDDVWMRGSEMLPDTELMKYECHAGIDFGKSRDLNALILMFKIDGKYYLKPTFWIPEETLKRDDREDYNRWVKEGLMKVMPGDVMRPEIIANEILAQGKQFKIKTIGYDPYLATHGTVQMLDDAGYIFSPLKQAIYSLSPYTKEFERLVFMGEIKHGSHPILRWMMANCVLDTDPNGNIKINKLKSGNKIDGIAATINALAQFMDFKDDLDLYAKQDIRFL